MHFNVVQQSAIQILAQQAAPPPSYGNWILLGIIVAAVFWATKVFQSKPQAVLLATSSNCPAWIGVMNSTNMVFGPLVMFFGGSFLGVVDVVSLSAVVLMFFAGWTGRRYFQSRPLSSRTTVLTVNLIAALLGGIVVLHNNAEIPGRFRKIDQNTANVVGVGLPMLPVAITLVTAGIILRRGKKAG